MQDGEIVEMVYRHMGRLDEPLRTYAFELAKAVSDATKDAERERCAKLCDAKAENASDESLQTWIDAASLIRGD